MGSKFTLIAKVQDYGGIEVGISPTTEHHIFEIECPELAELIRKNSCYSHASVHVIAVEPREAADAE